MPLEAKILKAEEDKQKKGGGELVFFIILLFEAFAFLDHNDNHPKKAAKMEGRISTATHRGKNYARFASENVGATGQQVSCVT